MGNLTRYEYDANNRRVKVTDARGGTTTTAYDKVSNISAIADSVGNTTSYTYDALYRLLTETNQLGKTRAYAYDNNGNQTQTVDRNGRKRTYDYDALNRQTAEHWLDASGNDIRTFSYGYDAVGHLLSSNDPDSKYAYTYDLVDRLTSIDNFGTPGVPNVLLNYGYDAAGNLLSVTDTIAGLLKGTNNYSYDILNRVTRITQSGNGVQNKRVDISYDAVNRLTGLNRYGDLAGTQSVADSTYRFDAAGRLQDLTHKRGANTNGLPSATAIASYGFSYDDANRITQSAGTDGIQDYSYDDANQLTAVDHTTQADEAYSYDANGNRTNAGYGTGTNNQLLTDGVYNYTYDDEGNRTKRTEIATGKVTEYSWDYRNRLTSVKFKDAGGNVVKTIEYAYDVNDRRIGKKIDGAVAERYVYDGANIALVFDGNGNQTHRYLYGSGVDQILADERGGSVVWALADNLGSVRDVVDGSGVVLNHITYDSFGRVISQTNPAVEFRYGYTGREQDGETGLDYYRARYYDSAVGRFISEDPIGFSAGEANLYRYVFNSPTNFTDPSGNVGNNVNPLPGVDPNCLALARKKRLEINPLCNTVPKPKSVPLSKARLKDIGDAFGIPEMSKDSGAEKANLGNGFEQTIIRSIQSSEDGKVYKKYYAPEGRFFSPSRAYETFKRLSELKKFGSPDLVGPVEVIYKSGGKEYSRQTFADSSIVEVKATQEPLIDLKFDQYQALARLDFAQASSAYRAGEIPRLTYITTSDTQIGIDLKLAASFRGIALYQAIVEESCSSPGSIKVGETKPQNNLIYKARGAIRNPQSDDTDYHTISSEFVRFRYTPRNK